jgi:hypothetical protein
MGTATDLDAIDGGDDYGRPMADIIRPSVTVR